MQLPEELYNIRFAEHFESIKALYMADSRFRIICNDYCSSILCIETYKKKIEKQYKKKAGYEILSKELEEEILFYLVRKSL